MAQMKITREKIDDQAREFGAELIGTAGISRWTEAHDVPEKFQPQAIWPSAKTVIVLGVPLWLPIVEAAPTVLGREQSIVTSELLDEAAYRLAVFLNHQGCLAVNIPSDSRGEAAGTSKLGFSHSWAGYYAGLGTMGWNNTLLTPEYGPRVHLVSVFTSLELEQSPLLAENLCQRCLYCQKICPAQALQGDARAKYAQLDLDRCLNHEKRLQQAFNNPCGACLKVCPIGRDRQLFQSSNFEKYFREQEILAGNPSAEEYQDLVQLRSYGSFPLEEKLEEK